jgi:hypothetical protein
LTRPTQESLAHAAGLLEELATRHHSRNNPNGFPDVATLLDLLVWVDTELEHAKHAAMFGPGGERSPEGGGTIGRHTIGRHGLGRPVEERLDWGTDAEDRRNNRPRLRPELADPLVRELQKLRAGWHTELAQLVDQWARRSHEAANWPARTQETGT